MTSNDLPRILIADDDELARHFLADNFSADGYDVQTAGSAGAARTLLAQDPVDLVLVDVNGHTPQLLGDVRAGTLAAAAPDTPVLVLTSERADHHRIRLLERGADDVQLKPYSYLELRLRAAALLRRTGRSRQHRLRAGAVELDPRSREVWVAGEPLHLSRTEFALLHLLAAAPTQTFTRGELVSGLWTTYTPARGTRALDSHAHRLRARLRDAGAGHDLIQNVWGVGYRYHQSVGS